MQQMLQASISVPAVRWRVLNPEQLANVSQPAESAQWVLYWMTAFRRTRSNYALQAARDVAKSLQLPLVILEALRIRYDWASDRLHRFIIQGMRDNRAACANSDALYYPYVEPRPGAGSGLVARLAQAAAVIVTDDYPCFFHPRMLRLVSGKLTCPLIAVDANCLMPLAAAERTFTVAHSYRRWMQKELPRHLQQPPDDVPLDGRSTRTLPRLDALPAEIAHRWPAADLDALLADDGLAALPIDHSVRPSPLEGGAVAAERLLEQFIERRLADYDAARNEPDQQGSSELSPYLHFGHISPHELFFRVMLANQWNPSQLRQPNGKVNGFWGVDENSEAFLDQLCTWREIGFNMCWREPDYDRLESLPPWAQQTLAEHASDQRPILYSLEQLEHSQTHDEIWNAAQRQLVHEGRIHNYLRMLWGKKILQWTPTVEDALRIMIHLNNKYALDGRDPNSYSGIMWVLGRYDRAWGPEREIFGKLRYMTSESAARKHALHKYLQRFEAG